MVISESSSADTTRTSASEFIFPCNPQLSNVFDFIENNFYLPITLVDVAQSVGYSPAYLTDLVRRQTGKTVQSWIIERRMIAACSLLLKTSEKVEQIAGKVGYQNAVHFFRQFRQYHQTTPQAWRKAHQISSRHELCTPECIKK